MSIRIVGGLYSGRGLMMPQNNITRPTTDKVREAVFNVLQHRSWGLPHDVLLNAVALDVCCGSGAYGLEAISQGADHVTLLDLDAAALRAVDHNVLHLGIRAQCRIIRGDCTAMPKATRPCNLIFIDPPYNKNMVPVIADNLIKQGWLANKAMIVVETSAGEQMTLPESFAPQVEKTYGDTKVSFYIYNK